MPITRIGAAKLLQSARKNKKNDDFFVGDQKGDKKGDKKGGKMFSNSEFIVILQ